MRKGLLACLLGLLLLAAPCMAETITACGLTVDAQDTYIDFGNVRVTREQVPELMAMLDQMPNLTQVDMYASSLKFTEMDLLFDAYPQIFFGWTVYIGDHKLRTDITAFSTLHGPTTDPKHSEQQFKHLRYFKNLKALDVGHNRVQDISFLYDLPDLEVLILACNQIKDVTPIASLKNLKYLELFTNDIRDIAPIAGMTSLRDLNIKNNPITDITPIMGMTWLKRFWYGMNRGDRVPEEQRTTLEAALPDCEIDWINNPTAGTWREHPYYFTLYDYFRTQEYVPYED